MVHVSEGNLGLSLSNMGTGPDQQQGLLRLIPPGGGDSYIVESGSVTVYAEGVRAGLPDGRGIFVASSGTVLLDLTEDEQRKARTGKLRVSEI